MKKQSAQADGPSSISGSPAIASAPVQGVLLVKPP
jgi:hypothetical protein